MAQKKYQQPPAMHINPDAKYEAQIKTTDGTIDIELLPKEAPKTVNNFVFLARDGYYKDVPFHRVIENFMVQTGDPTGTGNGGPGYSFADEKVISSYSPGTVAMANSGPNTNGSQFFIVQGKQAGLPPKYTIFGKVTSGMDVVDKIARTPTKPGGEGSAPVQPPKIEFVEIKESGGS